MGLFGRREREHDAWRQAAASLGLMYDEKDTTGISARDFSLLPAGAPSGADQLVHGTRAGTRVRVCRWTAVGRSDDFWRSLADMPSRGGKVVTLTASLVELPRTAPSVVLTRRTDRPGRPDRVPVATGHPGLDAAFECSSRRTGAPDALADPAFVDTLLAAPDDFAVEISEQHLLVVCAPRPADQLAALVEYGLGLARVVPSALYDLSSAT